MTSFGSDGLPIVVIGAGIGGLAAAMRLASEGLRVTVLDRAATPGGKMRTVPSVAGPVDAGPTVLTLRPVFEDLFEAAGTRLTDHVTLHRQSLLARHFWPDGSMLDLFDDTDLSIKAVAAWSNDRTAAQFKAFCLKCQKLFKAFDAPMMQAAEPSTRQLARTVLRNPSLLADMAPLRTMARQLARDFTDPRLAQLFGRYATYVGGSPLAAPALLTLIWQAEAQGVWTVQGGMHTLARAIADQVQALGGQFQMNADVARIELDAGRTAAVHLRDGTRLPCAGVVFNGDPRALATGALGDQVRAAAPGLEKAPRSHSAQVWSFAAEPTGPRAAELHHHNVFFDAAPASEFNDLAAGRVPGNPSIYICAEDRGDGHTAPNGPERFEIILNAPPLTSPDDTTSEDIHACHSRTFAFLRSQGLSFKQLPHPEQSLTTPQGFARLFPHSLGSLYGQSPHGMTASLKRPRAVTRIPGLFLAGGGTHPGAGVPMATLSGKHAAEAILRDPTLTSMCRPMAMPGGISTG